MKQVMTREAELRAYYSQSLQHLQKQISCLPSGTASLQRPSGLHFQRFNRDMTGQGAASTATPVCLDQQGAATDQGSGQEMQGLGGDSTLDEREGMRGSSAEDSDTGDDMDLDEAPPLPSDSTRQALTNEKQGCLKQLCKRLGPG